MKTKTKGTLDEFKVGKNSIGWVDSDFVNEFGKDKLTGKGKILKGQKLGKVMTDSQIISEFGIQECSLEDVLATIKSATPDMKDGWANLFYIKGHPSHVVGVSWSLISREWHVVTWGRDDFSWGGGGRVFSPATSGAKISASSTSESLTLKNFLTELNTLIKKYNA